MEDLNAQLHGVDLNVEKAEKTSAFFPDEVLIPEQEVDRALNHMFPDLRLQQPTEQNPEPKVDSKCLPPYSYNSSAMPEPSQHVRMLKFGNRCWDRSDGTAQRECTLVTVPLPLDNIQYLALSYVWGAPVDTKESHAQYKNAFSDWIIGESGTLGLQANEAGPWRLEIGRNLFEGLMRITSRVPHPEFYIWVDQICINQKSSSTAEKSAQIPLMADIYRHAASVVAWLGEGTSDIHEFWVLQTDIRQQNWEDVDTICQRLDIPSDMWYGLNWTAYKNFYIQTRWFRRAWVLQECALAKRPIIMGGPFDFNWNGLVAVATFLSLTGLKNDILGFHGDIGRLIRSPVDQYLLNFENQRKMFQVDLDEWIVMTDLPAIIINPEEKAHFQLLVLLLEIRECIATDPRDKVFAVLGCLKHLLGEKSNTSLRANYEQTYTAADAFADVTKVLVEKLPNFWIISYVCDPIYQSPNLGLPSWVPDLTTPTGASIRDLKYQLALYNASGAPQRPPDVTELLHIDKFTLTLSGVCFDTVAAAIPFKENFWAREIGLQAYAERSAELFEPWFENVTKTLYLESKVDVLWKTITAGRSGFDGCPNISSRIFIDFILMRIFWMVQSGLSPNLLRSFLLRAMELPEICSGISEFQPRQDASGENIPGEPSWQAELERNCGTFTTAWSLLTPDHILYRTTNGLFGQGPVSLQTNDQLWLVKGVRMPLVLREVPGTDTFKLLGLAYVHGYMNGELIDEWHTKYQPVKLV